MRASLLTLASVGFVISGCADGSGGAPDAGGEEDAGPPPTRDAGMRDAGGTITCPAGQHFCGGGCIDDLANEPANGCRLGCGEPCPTPPDGSPMCNASGMCGFACELPFRQEGTECVCTPTTCEAAGFDCGAPDDGCLGTLDCGDCGGAGVCNAGRCECTMDAEEPNEGSLDPASIATLVDTSPQTVVFDMFSLHSATDEDWFTASVSDNCCDLNPVLDVELSGVPPGDTYELTVYYVCDSGGDSSTCTPGSPCMQTASGATVSINVSTECSGLDESGTLYVSVSSSTWTATCQPYTLSLAVD